MFNIRYEKTIIHRLPTTKTFYCSHCGSKFSTTNWNKTKRGYSASCPCCPYRVWTK